MSVSSERLFSSAVVCRRCFLFLLSYCTPPLSAAFLPSARSPRLLRSCSCCYLLVLFFSAVILACPNSAIVFPVGWLFIIIFARRSPSGCYLTRLLCPSHNRPPLAISAVVGSHSRRFRGHICWLSPCYLLPPGYHVSLMCLALPTLLSPRVAPRLLSQHVLGFGWFLPLPSYTAGCNCLLLVDSL